MSHQDVYDLEPMMNFSLIGRREHRDPCTPFAALVVSLALTCGISLPLGTHAEAAEQPKCELYAELDTDEATDGLGPTTSENIRTSAVARHVATVSKQIVSTTRDFKVDAFASKALENNGARYVYGGTTPSGFDCSGFVLYSMKESLGIELPRTAAAQSALGESVPMDSLQKGDLLFWGSGRGVYHVGIYLENSTYIHAAGSGKGVRIQSFDFNAPTFAKRII